MGVSAGMVAGQLAYQVSPIVLTAGIATSMGGALPIVALTEGANFLDTLLSGGNPIDINSFFANYIVLAGGTLQQYQVSMYPLANQVIAANAVIAQPLAVSVLMQVPAKNNWGFALKLATMTALTKALSQHNLSGGMYSIVTPAYVYQNCLLTSMQDASAGDDTQQQVTWRLDFVQPLVTQAQAQTVLSGLMQKLSAGSPISGTPSWSGAASAVTSSALTVGNPASFLTSLQ